MCIPNWEALGYFSLRKIADAPPILIGSIQGPWCNWQHVNLSSPKVRVRIPPVHSTLGSVGELREKLLDREFLPSRKSC
jgi:hypothetical protein